jgi:hypothetical protein
MPPLVPLAFIADNVAAIGVLLAGIASMATALFGIWHSRKKSKSECDQRIEEIRSAFKSGAQYERPGGV